MKKLNIAIVGTGFGRSVHLPALQDSKYFVVKTFYHHNESKNSIIKRETGIECTNNWNELISDSDIDGIIIATPPHLRYKLALEALENKKHLLLEKPVTLKSNEIEELQRVALSKNLSVCVDFEYRAVPLFMHAKSILEKNKLGKVFLVKLDWLMGSRSDPKREWNWYSEENKGGGVIGALGTHAFDILHWFVGETKSVFGTTSTSIKERPANNDFKKVTSEDICLANLKIIDYLGESIPCQVSLSSISKNGRGFSLEIYGSNGSLHLKSENQKDYVHGFELKYVNKENEAENIKPNDDLFFKKIWADGRIAPVQRIHDWWAQSIYEGTPIIPGLSEGLQSQRVCDAIKESSNSGITAYLE